LLHSLRQGRGLIISTTGASDYLVPRLVASITLRRKNFRYWEKHGKKLSLHSAPRIELATDKSQPASQEQSQGQQRQQPSRPLGTSEKRTLMSMTEATKYQENLDDRTERGTVMSYTSTALDADGHCLELPNAPSDALEGKDFVCPYCFVLCPAKYGPGRAWRLAHSFYWLLVAFKQLTSDSGPTSYMTSSRTYVRTRTARNRTNSTNPGGNGSSTRSRSIGDYTDAMSTATCSTRPPSD
jgi:hypothetical protein